MPKIKKKRHINLCLVVLFFSLLALIYAFRYSYLFAQEGKEIGVLKMFHFQLSYWIPWIFFFPIVVWLGKRFPVNRRTWRWAVPFHYLSSKLFIFIIALISAVYCMYAGLRPDWKFVYVLIVFFGSSVAMSAIYGMIIVLDYLITHYKKNREQELQVLHMEKQLAQAHLKFLKSKLQPFFLFDTLQSIKSLMQEDVQLANKMIVQLSDLLRFSLERADVNEVRLQEELEFINIFLNIQKTRYKNNLKIEMDIDPETLDATVPSMILQPIVENAINEEIVHNKKPEMIRIVTRSENGFLVLEVHDNGTNIGLGESSQSQKKTGLYNSIKRLQQLYPDIRTFEIDNPERGEKAVRIVIPYKLYDKSIQEESLIE